jgi:hypothetical protein
MNTLFRLGVTKQLRSYITLPIETKDARAPDVAPWFCLFSPAALISFAGFALQLLASTGLRRVAHLVALRITWA